MRLIRAVDRWNTALSICFAFVLIGAIGAIDYVTGYQLSFSFFYFLPLFLPAWKGGRWLGLAGSLLCALVWAIANTSAGQVFSSRFTMYWNIGSRFLTFAVMTLLLSFLKSFIVHLESISRTDHLTGAANSRAFREQLGGEIERGRRHQRPFSLSYLDLDNFKYVNDSLGHATGDSLLKVVVSTIRSHVRTTDFVARLGGDEFGVILSEADQSGARVAIGRIRSGVVQEMESKGWPVTMSVGCLTCLDARFTAEELIRRADELMYEAKLKGKDMASFASLPISGTGS